MAIYTTFFICEPAVLLQEFPGWRPPLDVPIRREICNPFTGETITVESRAPEWPDEEDIADLDFHAVEIQGSYDDYLEGRLSTFIRNCPHWASKGLTPVELHPLLDLLDVKDRIESALYSPPASGNVLEEIPLEFVAKLSSLDVSAIAERWAAEISTPEHTHSVTGTKISDGWKASEATEILRSLIAISCQATANQRMYLLTEV
jgi:hypothetical protein